jgi:hypothetical protein
VGSQRGVTQIGEHVLGHVLAGQPRGQRELDEF